MIFVLQTLIGKQVKVKFDGVWYRGDVVKFDEGWYVIEYHDGDQQDMDKKEVEKHLCKKARHTQKSGQVPVTRVTRATTALSGASAQVEPAAAPTQTRTVRVGSDFQAEIPPLDPLGRKEKDLMRSGTPMLQSEFDDSGMLWQGSVRIPSRRGWTPCTWKKYLS